VTACSPGIEFHFVSSFSVGGSKRSEAGLRAEMHVTGAEQLCCRDVLKRFWSEATEKLGTLLSLVPRLIIEQARPFARQSRRPGLIRLLLPSPGRR
jgi:hypothetical protein